MLFLGRHRADWGVCACGLWENWECFALPWYVARFDFLCLCSLVGLSVFLFFISYIT